MKKLLISCVLLTGTAFGQSSVRFDSSVTASATNVPLNAQAPVYTVPNATVTVCAYPPVGIPCTNTVSIFQDQALTSQINNPLTADPKGRFGFWIAPGQYSYSVQNMKGQDVGDYPLSLLQGNGATIIDIATYFGDICAKINAAALAHPGLVLDARRITGTQTCASNPFTSTTGDIAIIFNDVTIQTTAPWVTNSAFNALIYGNGRGSNGRGTTIQAAPGFPATCDGLPIGCPVIRLGNGTQPTFGNRISNLMIDCNFQPSCIGLYSNDIQEQSGAEHFLIANFPLYGIFMDGTGGPGQGAENYALIDGEIYAGTAGTGSTIGVLIQSDLASSNGPRILSNLTSNGADSHIILSGFTMHGVTSGILQGLNAESAVTGYTIEPNGVTTSQILTLDDVQCNKVTATCLWLKAPLNDVSIRELLNGGGFSPVTLKDDTSGLSYTDFSIAQYVVGAAQNFRINSSTTGLNLFNTLAAAQFSVGNGKDAILQVDLDSGKTASQGQAIIFSDRGTNKYTLSDTTLYSFQLFDNTNSFTRFRFDTAGNDALNTVGAHPVYINADVNSGTGGLTVCGGGATPACPVNINGTGISVGGVPGFTGTKTAGACVLTIAGGIITNVTGC